MSKKAALLVGVNYKCPKLVNCPEYGCINDVWRMKDCLIEHFGFLNEDIDIMIDGDSSYVRPTASNILTVLLSLVGSGKPGHVLFFHFSGQGIVIQPFHRTVTTPATSNAFLLLMGSASKVIDLAKMEALLTAPAEVGKLVEEKEGLETEIKDVKLVDESLSMHLSTMSPHSRSHGLTCLDVPCVGLFNMMP